MSVDASPPTAFPLAILAKAPCPGQVKTRLIPRLGAAGAATLHRELVWHTLETAAQATSATAITLWAALNTTDSRADVPPSAADSTFLDDCTRHFGVSLRCQPAGDLGRRMYHALAAMPAPGLVIGCDCPLIDAALLKRCRAELATRDCVLLPAEDGGYALIGARYAERRLFSDIAWGTSRVMTQTLERLNELGWRHACPERVWDVDRPADIDRLMQLPNATQWRAFTTTDT